MIRSWIAARKSLIATVTSGVVVTAVVAAAAIISTGYSAQRLDLNDSSVWVANGADQYIGRANTEVFELNTIVQSSGNDIDVVQAGSTVLLVDHTDATLDIIDPATSQVLDSVALPPNQARVFLAGSNIVIYSQATGELWILALAAISSFDSTQLPSLNLGADSVVSVDPDGLLFGFSPDAGQVYRVDAATAAVVQQTENTAFEAPGDSFEITSVGGEWAVLDTDSAMLETARGRTDLSDFVDGTPSLQQPASEGDEVLVGHASGLVGARFGAGVTDLVTGRSGIAAAPAVVGGCSFAAWTDGGAWRQCDGDSAGGTELDLSGMPVTPTLEFRSNGDRMLLNDTRAGASWAVQSDGELINNWDDLISVLDDEQQVEQNNETTPPETEQTQLPPIALDDLVGARPGRASPVNVLLNDYDPNGDVLVVSAVDALDPAVGRLDIIHDSQAVQLTLAPGAGGTISFGYTISDGRGGSASATVTVTVRSDAENSPPLQVRQTRANVGSGGQVSLEVLGDWVDPDGDPFYLSDATVAEPDTVAHKADGTVVFSDSGSSNSGEKNVTLTVTDGSAEGLGSLLVSVSPDGEVPILCDPFVVLAYAGVEVRIAPLEHVRGGNGPLRLNAVPSKSGVSMTTNFPRGVFRVTSETAGTHYLDYVVADDTQTVTCVVRVDVAAPPDSNTTPITVPKTVFVTTLSSQTIDVASTDIDPGGGVLLVTGVMNIPTTSGIRAEVLEQRAVRITLLELLEGPVTFTYRISNGLAEAEGTITVIEIPRPTQLQPPIARDDTATVRVGDAITIPVMDNDEHPDGETITLDPVLVSDVGDDSGLLFTSGTTLRYLAPDHTGNFTATYRILGPEGQTAEAQVTIQVREPNADTNHAPAPGRITARVLAGEQVRIDVPLTGIDPDGDSVQLLGQETSPEKGTVVEVGADYILYEAGEYSAGTDIFTYALIDALGERATGTIRVGISPRLDGARNPVAIEDEVTVRTGASVSVQVLANDSDPDGSGLTVTSVVPNDDETVAEITDGSIVTITPPDEPGIYGVLYTITNERGGTSTNFVRVIVSDEAPLAYPVASDTVLTLSDILDRDTVDVRVLDRVFFADGAPSELGVSVLPGFAGSDAEVLPNKQIRVTIGDERQIIPFAVSHPDDPAVRSFAFIWVPGFNDALPQLDTRAGRLIVTSEETITFDINDYVIAVGGKQVRLTDSSTVSATHSDGSSLVVDRDTLQFTSADLYFGTASISFEVTDGSSATDPEGRKAILVLPIVVNPRENQAPSFNGAVIDFEPGQVKVIDLVQLTDYPYADDLDELAYSVIDAAPVGFDYSLNGQELTITAEDDAVKYATTSITLGVRDAVKQGRPGRIELAVVPSTRPLARPAADNATTRRGEQTVIDVLANDEATNPFPGQPLTVVQVTGTNGAQLPPGVTVSVSADNSRITVDVAPSAAPLDINLQYQVADATNDPDRYAWGTVRISIQDVPDAPAKPLRQDNSFVDGELTLRITPTQPNNSPVTNYRVTSSSHGSYTHDCGTSVICSLPGLSVGELYTFQVVATNAIGDSAPSPASDPYSIDYLPAAPASVTATANTAGAAGGAIDVSWDAVPNPSPGTAIVGYTVTVVGATSTTVGPGTTSTTISGLANDVVYTVVVYARNSAQVTAESDWNRSSTTVHTIGPPTVPAPAPQATSATNGDIEITWGPSSPNGGAPVTYDIARFDGAAAPSDCSASPLATGVSSPYTDTTAVDGETYTYVVYADNGSYCTPAATGTTVSLEAPGATSGSATVESRGTGQFDILAGALSASGTVVKYQYLLSSDGVWRDLPGDNWVTSLGAPGSTYGQAIDVSFRACRNASDSYCGAASAPTTLTPVNARVSSASCTPGAAPVIDQPANVGAVSAGYEVAYNQPILLIDNWSAFGSPGDPVPADATEMRVKATVNGYTDPGYYQIACTP